MEKAFETEDIRALYSTFITLCDYIEEEVGCGKCPMWDEICGHKESKKTNEFRETLSRIRRIAEIPEP